MPEGIYAVRSSASFEDGAVNSWAGQFNSFLRVPKEALAETVIRCWASCFSARALSYGPTCYKQPEDLGFAVIIQQMITPDYAGVAFSRHPVTGAKHTFIEMVKGSGDALVSGKAADFSAEVDHEEQQVTVIPDSQSTVVNRTQLLAIDGMVRTLEKEKGWPVDVEFCLDRQGLSLLQVRPLTIQSVGGHHALPHLRDYEMTFKVNGISLLFASILVKAFSQLDPLFTFDKAGEFRQYFTKEKMRWAAQRGLEFLSDEKAFSDYAGHFRKRYDEACAELDGFFKASRHDRESVLRFGDCLASLFELYSRMDVQYTNEAFLRREESDALSANLSRLAAFKDTARGWINSLFLPEDAPLSRFSRLMQEKYDCSAFAIENCTLDELASGRFERPHSEINTDAYIIWRIGDTRGLVTGNEAQTAIALMAEDDDFDPKAPALLGMVANGSVETVTGVVRIVEVDYANVQAMEASIDQMTEGEILVAEFTAPELLLACKKAKAIVTDIGGLLSHAAIVSRELNVPCLVGTKHGSKLFKTGESVKIDFKLGVISKVA